MSAECPKGCDNRAEEIPADKLHLYGGATHYSKILGYEVRGVYDGVLIWICGVCGEMWPRFKEGKLHEEAVQHIEILRRYRG